jgi:hypothetical protein
MPENVIQHEEVLFVLMLCPFCTALPVLLVTTAKYRTNIVLPETKSSFCI